ncbi:MAG: ATP-binding protein [Halodesulfurarchaeum sp.]
MDEYVEEFVREGEEHVTELNNALLALENDPTDESAMDRIFRTAHTLKGNFAAMGYQSASDLAHAVEDLLDEMRSGSIEVTPDRMDHVFAAVDEIEACLEEIDETGAVERSPDEVIQDLRYVLETCEAEPSEETADVRGESDDELAVSDELDGFAVSRLREVDTPIFRVHVDIGDTAMPGVDATFVLERIQEAYELLDTSPKRKSIENGSFDQGFDVALATDAVDVESTIGSYGEVVAVQATPIDDAVRSVGSDAENGERTHRTETGGVGTVNTRTDESAERNTSDTTGGEATDQTRGEDTDQTSGEATDQTRGKDTEKRGGEDTERTDGDTSSTSTGGKSTGDIQTVRVDVDQLDELHGLVEQLVTTRIKLRRGIDPENRRAEEELDELDKISSSLQDTVMDMRLVPMKKIVGKFPRLVRDLAREEGKQVDFTVEGDDVELDRTILTEISDPLMHLLRNAVDHGIEPPGERDAAGKDPTGEITLRAERERDRVNIQVVDDGRGIDPDALRDAAVEKGVRTREEVDALEDEAVPELVFAPGFSTTDQVTDVSGRGVGMDVVKDTVNRLDGYVDIESTPGSGTTITLTLPVTVAIVTVLFVESGEEEYGIPIKAVDEIGRMRPVKTVDGESVVTYGDAVYPLIRLGDALDVPGDTRNGDGMLVKIRDEEREVAIHCDDLRGQEEVVVKPFEGILSGIPGLSGAAVLGEGEVVTILDVGTL